MKVSITYMKGPMMPEDLLAVQTFTPEFPLILHAIDEVIDRVSMWKNPTRDNCSQILISIGGCGWSMIVKVQKYLMGNDPDRPWLIYNEDRTTEFQVPEKQVFAQLKKQMGHDYKGYFEVDVQGREMTFIKRVEDQDW